jgi:predicted nucleotidyltransferase
MIAEEVRTQIEGELAGIERAEDARILLAVESGSRAWGFPSRDSDYDVRFIYVRRPEWYLSIDLESRRDVVERPISDDLDISGWDVRKALRLFAKSNPPLLEWLDSPVTYAETLDFRAALREHLPTFYSPSNSVYHYLHMAQRNYREYVRGDVVWLKKYLYILRPLLAVRWIEQDRGVVPMEFDRLLATVEGSPGLLDDIRALVARKVAGEELDRGPAIPSISEFVAGEIVRLESFEPAAAERNRDLEPLNALYRAVLARAWREA